MTVLQESRASTRFYGEVQTSHVEHFMTIFMMNFEPALSLWGEANVLTHLSCKVRNRATLAVFYTWGQAHRQHSKLMHALHGNGTEYSPGVEVVIVGLTSERGLQLNGTPGVIDSDAPAGRIAVVFCPDSSGHTESIAVKPENVVKPWPLWRCARQTL